MPPPDGSRDAAQESRYSNHLEVGFNSVEFLLRFSQKRADAGERMVVEVVTNPTFARAFGQTLAEALTEYQARFGPIPDAQAADGRDDE